MKKRKIFIYSAIVILLSFGLYYFGAQDVVTAELLTAVKKGRFEIMVTNTGELRAKNYTEVMAPVGLRNVGIWQIKISNLIPEGTLVNEGDFVAELDKTEITNKINEETLNYQKKQSEFIQTQLDTTLTMRDARDELMNLKYAMEEKKLAKEQSIYEPPAILRQAEIEHEKALRNYEQKIQNYKTKQAQSRTKMEIIGSDLAKAKSRLDQLLEILDQLTVLAPKSGMLIYQKDWDGKKKVVGSMISAWEPTVAALPDLTIMESVTYINEVDIQKVKVGQKVILGLDAQPEKKLQGVIKSVANIGEQKPNSDAKVFEVVIDVITRDTTLRPSMTTSNQIITSTIVSALYIPLECIQADASKSFVYKRKGSSIVKQQVKIGQVNDKNAVVVKGLDDGDDIFLSAPADTSGLDFISIGK